MIQAGLLWRARQGIEGRDMCNVWITRIRWRTGRSAQGHQPSADMLRSTGAEEGEVGKQGHEATLGRMSRSPRWPASQLWTTGVDVDNST